MPTGPFDSTPRRIRRTHPSPIITGPMDFMEVDTTPNASHRDEYRILRHVEAIARHLRARSLHAEALAVENLGVMIEGYAEHCRPRP